MLLLLSGSAAGVVARRLGRAGCHVVAAPESYFIKRDRPSAGEKRRPDSEQLEAGEGERAAAWAVGLLKSLG
jgi:hypothetical protein